MELRAGDLDYNTTYKILTGAIVPRPIAWVTTMSAAGVVNAAPFSAFTLVSPDPPLVLFLSSRRERRKDTERNVRETKEFVVNIGDQACLHDLHMTSAALGPEQSETERYAIAVTPSLSVKPPRVASAPVCFECRLVQLLEFGNDPHTMVIGQVEHFYLRDDLYANGRIDQSKLQPIARIGGPTYAHLGEFVHLPPPAR